MMLFLFFLILFFLIACVFFAVPLIKMPVSKKEKIKVVSLLVFVFFVISGAGYYFFGAHEGLSAYQHALRIERIKKEMGSVETITQKLQSRLKEKPDAKGWYLLGKLYLHQSRFKEAVNAFHQGLMLRPDDAELNSAYKMALSYEKEEKRISALPGILVKVDMPEKIKKQFKPETVVFVVLKTQGMAMPIAAVKKQIEDLPLTLKFTDQSLMIPGHHLREFNKIEIIAKTALSGTPAAIPGDYEGNSVLKYKGVNSAVEILINTPIS